MNDYVIWKVPSQYAELFGILSVVGWLIMVLEVLFLMDNRELLGWKQVCLLVYVM